MATKRVTIPDVGEVILVKSAQSRSIRLRVTDSGVRVSLPRWTPYVVGVAFARQHAAWILDQKQMHQPTLLMPSMKIGKLHTLQFEPVATGASLRTIVSPTKLIVPHYVVEPYTAAAVQRRAEKAALRALRREAETVLPPLLAALAERFGHTYRTVSVRQLKRRWGSCDSKGSIVLNLFLMQLTWQQIDYVLCHELAHTKHMDHGGAFWREVERMLPDARMIAKKVRYIQPALQPRVDTRTDSAVD